MAARASRSPVWKMSSRKLSISCCLGMFFIGVNVLMKSTLFNHPLELLPSESMARSHYRHMPKCRFMGDVTGQGCDRWRALHPLPINLFQTIRIHDTVATEINREGAVQFQQSSQSRHRHRRKYCLPSCHTDCPAGGRNMDTHSYQSLQTNRAVLVGIPPALLTYRYGRR